VTGRAVLRPGRAALHFDGRFIMPAKEVEGKDEPQMQPTLAQADLEPRVKVISRIVMTSVLIRWGVEQAGWLGNISLSSLNDQRHVPFLFASKKRELRYVSLAIYYLSNFTLLTSA